MELSRVAGGGEGADYIKSEPSTKLQITRMSMKSGYKWLEIARLCNY